MRLGLGRWGWDWDWGGGDGAGTGGLGMGLGGWGWGWDQGNGDGTGVGGGDGDGDGTGTGGMGMGMGVMDLPGPPLVQANRKKIDTLKRRAQEIARDLRSRDDVQISYLETLEECNNNNLRLAQMLAR
jgi:hypothetical protein